MVVRIKTVVLLLITASSTLLCSSSVFAAEPSYELNAVYQIQAGGKVIASQAYALVNHPTNTVVLKTHSLNVEGISVVYNNGAPVAHKVREKEDKLGDLVTKYKEIELDITGRPSDIFTLKYVINEALDTKAKTRSLYLANIVSYPNTKANITLDVPLSFGMPTLGGSIFTEKTVGSTGNRQLKLTDKQLFNNSLYVAFGTGYTYNAKLNYEISNNGLLPGYRFVTLPPDINNQKVYLKGLSKKPNNVEYDKNGNIVAKYWLWPRQKFSIEAEVMLNISAITYDLSKAGKFKDIPEELKPLTSASRLSGEAGNIAKEVVNRVDKEGSVADGVRIIQEVIRQKLQYSPEPLASGKKELKKDKLEANAFQYAELTSSTLRQIGIPTRLISGALFSDGLKLSNKLNDAFHVWVEAYVPDVGWITVDPAWSEKFDNFGVSSPDRIALQISENNYFSSVIKIDGDYSEEALPVRDDKNIKLTARCFLILPFVSLDKVTISGIKGYGLDKLSLTGNDKIVGSLAPEGKYITTGFIFGADWFKPAEIKLVSSSDTKKANPDQIVLATTSFQINYLPLVVICIASVVVILLVLRSLKPSLRLDQTENISTEHRDQPSNLHMTAYDAHSVHVDPTRKRRKRLY